MSGSGGQFMVEYRAARVIMQQPPSEVSAFLGLVKHKIALFYAGECTEFQKCPHCCVLYPAYKSNFISLKAEHLAAQRALDGKLAARGILNRKNSTFVRKPMELAIAATDDNLTCVLVPNSGFIDGFEICSAATVAAMPVEEFIAILQIA